MDYFSYASAADSPLQTVGGTIVVSGNDVISGFQAGVDEIFLGSLLLPSASQSVVTKSTSGFSTNLNNGAGYFGTAAVAVEYAGAGASVAARVYVDVNRDGNLGGGDLLIQLTGVGSGSITNSSVGF